MNLCNTCMLDFICDIPSVLTFDFEFEAMRKGRTINNGQLNGAKLKYDSKTKNLNVHFSREFLFMAQMRS